MDQKFNQQKCWLNVNAVYLWIDLTLIDATDVQKLPQGIKINTGVRNIQLILELGDMA